jgi:DNA-binding beta-propeller fold protein YncE
MAPWNGYRGAFPTAPRPFPPMVLSSLLVALVSLTSSCTGPQSTRARSAEPLTPGLLLVSSYNGDAVFVYRASDGAYRGLIEGIDGPQSIARGPDGLLYVAAEQGDAVMRVDPETLQVVDAFIIDDPSTPEDETGGLDAPTAAFFGPWPHLFVTCFDADRILRYDARDGSFVDEFVAPGSGGLDGPDAGAKFGPDGDLYVPSFWNDRVLRYDGATGAFVGVVASGATSPLDGPRDVLVLADRILVASSLSSHVLEYDRDGNYLGVFAVSNSPYCLRVHPDDGRLYVVSLQRNNVRVFDLATGAFHDQRVANRSGGLTSAVYLGFAR